MHTWHWHTWQGLPYLTCSLLEDWHHGFFTQRFWSRPPEELTAALLPDADVYRVKQVHGNRVLSAPEIEQHPPETPDNRFPNADGVITTGTKQAAWVCTADCTPVLIADERTGQVAAIHAGWRGTALKIVPRAIDRLVAQGSPIEQLRVAMGPAIAGDCYQVSTQVAARVGATVVSPALAEEMGLTPNSLAPDPEAIDSVNAIEVEAIEQPETVLASLRTVPDSPILDDPQPGRLRLDVRRVNTLQLLQLGLTAEQIAIAPYCTYQNPELFFSYRRTAEKKVQWSGIVSA